MNERDKTASAGGAPAADPPRNRPDASGRRGFAGRAMEGAVIVASILLAFGIEAAWEEREENVIEQEILESIQLDMESNMALINGYVAQADSNISRLANFLSSTPEALEQTELQYAGLSLQALYIEGTIQPVYGSLSPTNLTLVRDLELRNELSSWLSVWEDIQETAPYQIQGSFDLIDLGGELGALMSSGILDFGGDYGPPQQALATLRRDDHFVNTVFRNVIVRGISAQKLARLRDSTERLLELLAELS